MKIAYLISTYTDPEQLMRLVDALYVKDKTRFFIHIDKGSQIDKALDFGEKKDQIKLTGKRVFVTWGGYSQCLYQKILIDECIESGIEFDRVMFLTGQDYPLVSNEFLFKELESYPGKEFIAATNISRTDNLKQRSKIDRYHFYRDIKSRNSLWTSIKKLRRGILKNIRIKKNPNLEINGKTQDIYFGSSYCCLSFDCIKFIQKEMNKKVYKKYFKHTYIPEELLIPTIIFNSEFKDKAFELKGEPITLKATTPIHFIDYGKEVKKFTEKDFDQLTGSGKWFFRKAATGVSDKLLDLIDLKRSHEASFSNQASH